MQISWILKKPADQDLQFSILNMNPLQYSVNVHKLHVYKQTIK